MADERNTPRPSRGSEALDTLLEERDEPARKLATDLGVGPDLVSRWRRGLTPPSGPNRTRIERALGIPSTAWDEPVDGAA